MFVRAGTSVFTSCLISSRCCNHADYNEDAGDGGGNAAADDDSGADADAVDFDDGHCDADTDDFDDGQSDSDGDADNNSINDINDPQFDPEALHMCTKLSGVAAQYTRYS